MTLRISNCYCDGRQAGFEAALAALGMWRSGDGFLAVGAASVVFAGMGGSLGPNLDAIAITHLGPGNMHAYGRIRGWESFTYAIASGGSPLAIDPSAPQSAHHTKRPRPLL